MGGGRGCHWKLPLWFSQTGKSPKIDFFWLQLQTQGSDLLCWLDLCTILQHLQSSLTQSPIQCHCEMSILARKLHSLLQSHRSTTALHLWPWVWYATDHHPWSHCPAMTSAMPCCISALWLWIWPGCVIGFSQMGMETSGLDGMDFWCVWGGGHQKSWQSSKIQLLNWGFKDSLI